MLNNTNKGSKTIYDPCPPGWRVPPGYAFANVSGSYIVGKGASYPIGVGGASMWFPASGCQGNTASLTSVAESIRSWQSSPALGSSMNNGGNLKVTTTAITLTAGNYRSCSAPVRCTKE